MDILLVKVVEHHAAIFMIVTDIYIFTLKKLTENTASNFAKVACDDIIEVGGGHACVGEKCAYGGKGCRCHGCTHVVGVAHAQVNYFSDSTAPDVGGLVRGGNHQ